MVNKNNLPAWLSKTLKSPEAIWLIDFNNSRYFIENPSGSFRASFNSLDDVYEFARNEGVPYRFSRNIPEYTISVNADTTDSYQRDFIMTSPDLDDGYSRLYLESFDENAIITLEEDYEKFLEISTKYLQDPTSFFNSYNFIDTHPMFWIRTGEKNTHPRNDFWKTEGFVNDQVHMFLSQDETDGKANLHLETGGHVEPDYRTYYGDYRLHLEANSFEAGLVKLAALINSNFNLDGSDKNKS